MYLKNVISNPNILVGGFTIYNDFVNDPRRSYSIAPTIRSARCLLIPFPFFFEEWGLDARDITGAWDNKGDIVIGNDVWVGYEAVILAGVTIGDGAMIGARSVVTRDIPPYMIVGGIPAKPIRRRFPDQTISDLLGLKWWDWPEEKIAQNIALIQSGQIEALRLG